MEMAENSKEQSGAGLSLLDLVVKNKSYDESQMATAMDTVNAVIALAKQGDASRNKIPLKVISERIGDIDAEISDYLDQILHDPKFMKLESAWRGLHYLVSNTETSSRLKLRVLNVSKEELQNDLEKASDFDQSALFKKVYEEEYGTFGGYPFSVLIGDFAFDRTGRDIGMLSRIANVAAATHAPFIAAADPLLFDMKDYTGLALPRDLSKTFDTDDMIKWRAFRDSDDARYVSLVLPRMLLRLPYGDRSNPAAGLNYEENMFDGQRRFQAEKGDAGKQYLYGESVHQCYLWGNPAYALGQRITSAFAQYGWCAAIRGVEGGGAVTGLPVFTYSTDAAGKLRALQCPTELSITDRREKELSDLGFIPLCHKKSSDLAAFFGAQTAGKPKKYNLEQANSNARLSALLPYVLSASRFAHYLKVIMRDKIGSFMTRENVEQYLNNWIADYVLVNDNAPQSIKAQFPLREARVDVVNVAGKPGVYRATVFLKPHFQLEELTASIRLVADLPPPAAA
jgi:type VI secretion system protein ImpC